MSRSYKKTPYCGDPKSKDAKRAANKRVRIHLKDMDNNLSGSCYKKLYDSYDICDYYDGFTSFDEYYAHVLSSWVEMYNWCRNRAYHSRWLRDNPPPTREYCWKQYKKYYLNK